jgi:integrase
MARPINKLTPAYVERKSKVPGFYNDGGGLYFCVKPPAAKSWVFRFMLNRKRRDMGLGSYPEISLTMAREEARRAREAIANREDPITARDALEASKRLSDARAVTFRQCAETYIADHRDDWRNAKHAAQWTATLEAYALPVLGGMAVADIESGDVLRVLDPIWKDKNETARRVRGRIEAILDWAKARSYRKGENAAAWKGNLAPALRKRSKARRVVHHPALPYKEVPAFVEELKDAEGIGADAMLFTILTAARTGESIGAKWEEFDLDAALWAVPAERTKTAREHRVPLSEPAMRLLRRLSKTTGGKGFVFPGGRRGKPLSNMAMLKTLERMGRDDLTVHGFRSSFRDWAEEQTAFGGSIAEAALGHIVGDKVEAAYRRGDLFEKRQRLMELWGVYCTTLKAGGKVMPIRALG